MESLAPHAQNRRRPPAEPPRAPTAAPPDSAATVRRWFEAFARQDLATARSLLAEDAVLHHSGPSGETDLRVDFDGLMTWLERRRAALSDLSTELHDLCASNGHAFALLELSAERDGRRIRWDELAVYEVEDGRIREIWLLDQPARPS